MGNIFANSRQPVTIQNKTVYNLFAEHGQIARNNTLIVPAKIFQNILTFRNEGHRKKNND